MKIALTADWHFRGKDLDAAIGQLDELIEQAHAHNCSAVCVAGDVFDRENIADAKANVGEIAAPLIERVRDSNLNWLFIPGNHDYSGPTRTPATELFRGLPNVDITNEATVVPVGYSGPRPVAALCLPWEYSSRNPEEVISSLLDAMRGHGGDPATLLLGHVRVIGGRLSALRCHEAHGGWEIRREYLEGLSVDRVALGDFHGRQDLSNGKGGYIGALRQLNFGEEGNPAGFEVWDPATGLVEFVALNAAPIYRTVEAFSNIDLDAHLRITTHEPIRLRVMCQGYTPDRALVAKLEAVGAEVVHHVGPIERQRRDLDVPEGILASPDSIIRLYAKIVGEADEERVARLVATFHAAMGGTPFTQSGTAPTTAATAPAAAHTPASSSRSLEELAALPCQDADIFAEVRQ